MMPFVFRVKSNSDLSYPSPPHDLTSGGNPERSGDSRTAGRLSSVKCEVQNIPVTFKNNGLSHGGTVTPAVSGKENPQEGGVTEVTQVTEARYPRRV